MLLSAQERQLCQLLRDLPRKFQHRYTETASSELLEILFRSFASCRDDYLRLLFPGGPPSSGQPWSLRAAQGAVEGAEYTEAARGQPCGHIFKSGEATYRCKTCAADDTCVLCARCFDCSDHEGHVVYISVSPGNSGCCDCGDDEAWVRPVHCSIHTLMLRHGSKVPGKGKQDSALPQDLLDGIRVTVARVLDYLCDVFSCSPEQLRLPKTEQSVRDDERLSRLSSKWYDGADVQEADEEFALVLWNDEKHTVNDVRDIVARACKQRSSFGLEKAYEVDEVGRSVLVYSTDLQSLLRMAQIIEQIKLTVTIRSARDTFRERMCGTIIEWVSDIAGCSVGNEHHVIRNIVCEEMLKPWRMGSGARHKQIGIEGLDDHQIEESDDERRLFIRVGVRRTPQVLPTRTEPANEGNVEDWDDDDQAGSLEEAEDDEMDIDEDNVVADNEENDLVMEGSDGPDDILEVSEATLAGYPSPPTLPPNRRLAHARPREQLFTPTDSDDGEPAFTRSMIAEPLMSVPRTPNIRKKFRPPRPPRYWLEKPEGYGRIAGVPPHEDLWQRVRLDFLILYDLRMWKKVRIDMRDVFISTVVNLPKFKRLLGLRFAGLYTTLAQLYLIADREPEHSIINLSLQMLTTPSITAEVVERGNFLTNLMAILYTFLTSRQVGYPSDVNPLASLAFESGAVTNRRLYHFFMDMKYLLASEYVHDVVHDNHRYLLQFLDLAKLYQGICPNVRAVGEHIEYENDGWVNISTIIREVNKLCRQFAEAFVWSSTQDPSSICRAIRQTAKIVTIHSLGSERRRFDQAEIKSETRFKVLKPFELGLDEGRVGDTGWSVVDFVIEREPISCHHALHYTLSWLIDRGKSMSREQLLGLLLFSAQELKQPPVPVKAVIPDCSSEEYLLTLFDFPLRVCAWLAQIRAGMWVRNGATLRHQMHSYRGVGLRDISYQRDVFLLQVALVLCPTSAFLASMVDRYGMTDWMRCKYDARAGYEDHQVIDVVEDFVHLLIILLSDRVALLPLEDEARPHILGMRRDIAHILCFKPLSYSELTTRLSDKVEDSDEFPEILDEMATFRPPEGLLDSGTFELKEQYIEEIDPYIAQYNRNQREEAENICKNYMAKKTGQPAADIVYEPKLRKIRSGIFKALPAFTRLAVFGQIVYSLLGYAISAPHCTPKVPATRVEAFLHFVLQLIVVAMSQAHDGPHEGYLEPTSFITLAAKERHGIPDHPTIVSLLQALARMENFKPCEPKIRLIIARLRQAQPSLFQQATIDRMDTARPVSVSAEKELKKKLGLESQARVMAQFKQQQNNFMENQAIDWGDDDFSDLDEAYATPPSEQEKHWKYPTGTCILCQEETDDQRLYGTFVMITESTILRQTNIQDPDWVGEVLNTPLSLDRSAEVIRPFGVAGQNRKIVEKVTADGRVVITERQGLSTGFPCSHHTKRGPVATGCGHIMHYSCFDVYTQATQRRHINQIARNHPERIDFKEFLCPLCKALGNAFLPIIWKGKKMAYPGVLKTEASFDDWLGSQIPIQVSRLDKSSEKATSDAAKPFARVQKMFIDYGSHEIISPLASKLTDLSRPNLVPVPPPQTTR